nr:MAG TPA: hypothetical protein [Bacteriophage sp.]
MNNKYYIVRAKDAGVFAGKIRERNGTEVTMTNVRQLWYWDGAASLMQMAQSGVTAPRNCKFTVTIEELTIMGVCEILPCTDGGERGIEDGGAL